MLPSTAQTVVICADRDASAGKRAAHNVCARTREAMLVHDSTVPAVLDSRPRTMLPSLGAGGMRPQQPDNMKPARLSSR